MTALDFLSPDRAKVDTGFTPALRSSMERHQRDAGAQFEERDGWLVPVRFSGEADRLRQVGIADLSHLGKLEVFGDGAREERPDLVWYPYRPGRALVLCPYRDCFL